MIFKGEELIKAWKDFEGTEPVKAAEVTDEPEFLAFLGDSLLYPVSRETSDALYPLMATKYESRFSYNGTDYGETGHLCEVDQIHMGGRRYFRFCGTQLETAAQLLRVKRTIEAVRAFEREKIEKKLAFIRAIEEQEQAEKELAAEERPDAAGQDGKQED